ncbi:MFS transporter [Cytobacillus massiliigabonensis]|uniref:MFS transporter n=1 Tax=Cytobacillus massiliigabonensis TaxID=1871011 RepID=UPI000C84D40A|nr:MFS transporter [Cytobacillus massiliigabonensis]
MKSISFRKLWIGQSIANFGDVLYIVAFITVLYEVTGSAFYLTLLPFLNMLGRFISSFYAPILMNRIPLVVLLYRSQVIKTAILFVLCLLLLLKLDIILVFILTAIFFIAFFDGWAMPAMNAMLPRLVEEEELAKANSFVAVLYESIQLAGWAIGGIAVNFLSGSLLIWLTVLLYFISTIMMAQIRDPIRFEKKEQARGKLDEILEGWKSI